MSNDETQSDAIEQKQKASVCPSCSGSETEIVESDQGEDRIRRTWVCNDCYAGWDAVYANPEIEITHEPKVEA